jgi:hypothetical protein
MEHHLIAPGNVATLIEALAMPERRFPPPWSAEVQPNYYVVRDANGQQIAYLYYSNDPDRRTAAKLLTKDEARRIAASDEKFVRIGHSERGR